MEIKDDEVSTPSEESQLKQHGGRQNESASVWKTLVSQTERRGQIQSEDADRSDSPQAGPSAKVCSPQKALETVHNVDTAKADQSISGNRPTEAGDFNQSESPKRSKTRRQRRKGSAQQVVGLPRAPSTAAPVLLWFRRDLRLCDNPALVGALGVSAPVIPIFIWSPEEEEGPGVTVAAGGACKLTLTQLVCASMTHRVPFLCSQVNTGSIKLCRVCVRPWRAPAAASSSSGQGRRGARGEILSGH